MKIFISYRRAEDDDTYIVGTLRKSLVGAFPNEVFRDTYDIRGGADWRAVLKGEIEACRVMLVVIGPEWANLKNAGGRKRLEDPEDVTAWEVETGLKRSAEGRRHLSRSSFWAQTRSLITPGMTLPKTAGNTI
jgi:hypothetical protein